MRKHIAGQWVIAGCLALLATCPAGAEDGLTLSSPRQRQVTQRDKQDRADVVIAGVVRGAVDTIEAKADLTAGAKRGKPVDWAVIAKGGQIAGGKFAGRMTLQAGGWYALTVRALRGKDVLARSTIAKVGVGEVFITAGQSNSANYGRPRQAAKDDRVVYFNGTGFVPAKDPIPGACGGGGSVWSLLGDRIVTSQQVPICFRSASLTWTEVKNWLPGVKCRKFFLYDNLVKCTKAFGANGVRAVLWHQGESDSLARTSAETYCNRLKTVIESLNRDAACKIPWFVAKASFHPGSKPPQENQVAKGQELLWTRGIACQGPVTDDLLGKKYRCDGVHFNQLGLETHAERWFQALAAHYKWKVESPTKKPAEKEAK